MSWTEKSLNELGLVARGKSKHRPRDAAHLYDGPYPFIQTGDVKHAPLYLSTYSKTYSEEGLKQSKLWKKGTLCITIAANIADSAILDIDACFPDSVIGFVANEEVCDTKFIKYTFNTLQQQYKQFSQGAAQDNLSLEKLLSIKFKIPSLPVQQKIAGILSAYDDLIDNNHKRIALLEKAARLLYEEWFVRLQFPGHEHMPVVNGVPEGWERKTIDDIGAVITGKTPDTARANYYGGDVPFIKTPDMHGNVYVIETESSLSKEGADIQPKKYLPKNAILVACIGAKLGVVSLSPGVSQTNQQINAVVVHDKAATYFAFFTLRDFKPRLEAIGGGATMPNVNKSKFGSLDFLLPSKALLQAFDEFCKPVFAQIMTLQQQNRKLQATHDLLLPRLMSGELAV